MPQPDVVYALGAKVVVSLGGAGIPSAPRHEARIVGKSSLWGLPLLAIEPPHPEAGRFFHRSWLLPLAQWPAERGGAA